MINFDKTVVYKQKVGISRLIQLCFHNFTDIILLNLLFVLTSLPIVTLGASFSALYRVFYNMIIDKPTAICKDYFQFFVSTVKKGVLSTIFQLIIFASGSFSFIFYYYQATESPLMSVLSVLSLICLILAAFCSCYYFPLLSITDLKMRYILKNSLIMALVCPFRSLALTAMWQVLFWLSFLFFPYSIIFVFLAVFAFPALFTLYAVSAPIDKYIINKNGSQ